MCTAHAHGMGGDKLISIRNCFLCAVRLLTAQDVTVMVRRCFSLQLVDYMEFYTKKVQCGEPQLANCMHAPD